VFHSGARARVCVCVCMCVHVCVCVSTLECANKRRNLSNSELLSENKMVAATAHR
jgi:hypothetical protein